MMPLAARSRTVEVMAPFLIAAVSIVTVLNGRPFAADAFDVKQICHDAVSHELHARHGLPTYADYSTGHASVTNRPLNTKEVHGDGKYHLNGSTTTFKFDCLVDLFDGRVKYLAVHH